MFLKLIIEVRENKGYSIGMAQRITEDKRENKDFPRLPSATSSIQKIMV
jgi:hypothetical protein